MDSCGHRDRSRSLHPGLATKPTSSRLCWEGEDGADELLLSLFTPPPLEQQVSGTLLRVAGMLKLSSDLSGVKVTGHGHTVNSLSAPEQNVVMEATKS